MARTKRHQKDHRPQGVIPYSKQTLSGDELSAIDAVFQSGWLTQGPAVAAFEQAFAQSVGARFAVAVSNGTAALHSAYLAAGIGSGDEVIVPANTFVATANMVLAAGAKPVFCDIRTDTYNIDETKIEALITKRTKAIVPVHYAGHPAEMDAILSIAKKHGLIVVEDACHALGAEYKNEPIGSLSSVMTVFSFHPVKSITTGEGGMVTTSDPLVHKELVSFRSHGIEKDKEGWNTMVSMGFNYRMTDIQAALGSVQLTRLSSFIKARRDRVKAYERLFADSADIILPHEQSSCVSAWHLYPVLLAPRFAPKFMKIASRLREAGIGIQRHYPPVYSHPYYRALGYKKGLAPNAEDFYARELSLPLFPAMTGKEQKYVVDTLLSSISELA